MNALIERQLTVTAARRLVVALHCSGGTPGQWRPLATRLGPRDRLLAPPLHGAPGGPRWSEPRPFRLHDDARSVLAAINAHEGPVHLAGHSYGGAVALHIAALVPGRITSMSLYEPTSFHLLPRLGRPGIDALREIEAMHDAIVRHAASGKPERAIAVATDYWNGAGAYANLEPEITDALASALPQLQLAYDALLAETSGPAEFGTFAFPVRLLRGALAPFPTRILAEGLSHWIPGAELVTLHDLGHMGPLTQPNRVAALMRPL
jgi:pimeloyl-ACP methyl ester carboxylesterase